MNQEQGYMIVLKPEHLVAEYDRYAETKEWIGSLRVLRHAFRHFHPAKYRGISRDPLQPYESFDQKINDLLMESDGEVPCNVAARRRYREILGEPKEDIDLNSDFDEKLLSSVNDANDILSLTDDPTKWEIIQIARTPSVNTQTTLGYDIGYWGGDNFSIIADVCVIPRWHPPIPEDFENVIEALSSLNNYMLFNSAEEAENYRQFYKSKTWAEKEYEEGEFCIIQINSVSKV
jgi:hypothetical protein